MEHFGKYFTSSDHYILLGAEKIYLQFFAEELGTLDKRSQIKELIERLGDPDMNFPMLCSIYYLLSSHTVDAHKSGLKCLKISVDPHLINEFTSIAVLDYCVKFLSVEIVKNEEVVHFRVRAVLDLVHTLLVGHYNYLQYALHNNVTLFDDLFSFCLKSIKLSQERPDVPLRRIAAVFLIMIRVKFRKRIADLEVDGEDWISADQRKVELDKLVTLGTEAEEKPNLDLKLSLIQILKNSRHEETEKWYTSLMTDPANPLPAVLVVGYLRALLNLANTARATNSTGYDCTSELESNYNYCVNYLRDFKQTLSYFNQVIDKSKETGIKHFIFQSLQLETYDPTSEGQHEFFEVRAYEVYKSLYLKGKELMPEALTKEIETLESAENKTPLLIEVHKALLNEVYSHRAFSIFFMFRTFALIHSILKDNNFLQAVSLGMYIYDAKGILVILKIISEKILQSDDVLERDLVELSSLMETRQFRVAAKGAVEGIIEDIIYLFLNITYDYPEIISDSLIGYKAHLAMKKYMKQFPSNPVIMRGTYYMIKRQLNLMSKSVRSNLSTMGITSFNYSVRSQIDVDGDKHIPGIDGDEPEEKIGAPSQAKRPEDAAKNRGKSVSKGGNISVSSFAFSTDAKSATSDSFFTNLQHFKAHNPNLPSLAHLDGVAAHKFKPVDADYDQVRKGTTFVNSCYNKLRELAVTVVNEHFAPSHESKRPEPQIALYNKLYAETEIPANFELFYERWLTDEGLGIGTIIDH